MEYFFSMFFLLRKNPKSAQVHSKISVVTDTVELILSDVTSTGVWLLREAVGWICEKWVTQW